MSGRRNPSSDGSNVALLAAAGAVAAISSVGIVLALASRERRSRFQDSKELYIPSRYNTTLVSRPHDAMQLAGYLLVPAVNVCVSHCRRLQHRVLWYTVVYLAKNAVRVMISPSPFRRTSTWLLQPSQMHVGVASAHRAVAPSRYVHALARCRKENAWPAPSRICRLFHMASFAKDFISRSSRRTWVWLPHQRRRIEADLCASSTSCKGCNYLGLETTAVQSCCICRHGNRRRHSSLEVPPKIYVV